MKVLCVVLTLAVHMICRLGENDGSVLPCTLAVGKSVLHAHLNDVRTIGKNVALGNRDASLAGAHLDAVVRNSQPYRKSKRRRKPFGCSGRIRVDENGDHGTWRNGAVCAHDHNLTGREAASS